MRALRVFMTGLIAASQVGCLGIHQLAFNPDADLRHGERWVENMVDASEFQSLRHSVWLRLRTERGEGFDVDHLLTRLESAFTSAGWHVTQTPDRADLWLDINLRFWGENTRLDDGASTFLNLSDGLIATSEAPGSRARTTPIHRSAPTAAKILLPGIPQASSAIANTREWNLILDVRHSLHSQPGVHRRDTLICWARRIDLDAAEATDIVSAFAPKSILARLP